MATKYIKGIDVSRWQGPIINWAKVKSLGNQFAFIKSSDGSAYKKAFIEIERKQAQEAKAVGLKIGYYHFSHPDKFIGVERDAKSEATYFLNTIKTFPNFNFPLVLDLEDEKLQLNQVETELWVKIFKDVINQAGYEMVLYSYAGYLNRVLPKTHQLGGIPLWLANYPKVFDLNQLPNLAKGWDNWVMWQYSEKGVINGITGKTDLNLMTVSFFEKY